MDFFLLAIVVVVVVWLLSRKSGRTLPRASVPAVLPPKTKPHKVKSKAKNKDGWVGYGCELRHGGYTMQDPLAYVANREPRFGPSTIVRALRVGNAARALPLPYWPSYADASPDQRAAYLEFLESGKAAPSAQIGLVFMYYYGLERRVFTDRADLQKVEDEVRRLLRIYGDNGSFHRYAYGLLAYLAALEIGNLSAAPDFKPTQPRLNITAGTLPVVLGWHNASKTPLPADLALDTVSSFETAKRSVVVKRAPKEFIELFAKRYREEFGDGLVAEKGKRPTRISYTPASMMFDPPPPCSIPNVLGRKGQFKPILDIYNQCIDELKKFSSLRRKQQQAGLDDGTITAEAWDSLPVELKAKVDHPLQEKWRSAIPDLPRIGSMHIVDSGCLVELALDDGKEKLTLARCRRVAETASSLGFAVEPDPRLTKKGWKPESKIIVWRSEAELPEPTLYQAIANIMSLMIVIVLADDVIDDREIDVMDKAVNDMFPVSAEVRARIEALREHLIRSSNRGAAIAKRIKESRSEAEAAAIGELLVAVAAADGVLDPSEYRELKRLFRALGRPVDELEDLLVQHGIADSGSEPVLVQESERTKPGEAIKPPSREPKLPRLDRAEVARILNDSSHVTQILADVFDAEIMESGNDEAKKVAADEPDGELLRTRPQANSLDVRYHGAAAELLTKTEWSRQEVDALARQFHLIPGAIFDAINDWSIDAFGDELIEEDGGWRIHQSVLEGKT